MDIISFSTWLINDFFISMLFNQFQNQNKGEKKTQNSYYGLFNNHALKTSAQM